MIDFTQEFQKILVKHQVTGEIYEANLLELRHDRTCVFQITGERAKFAKSIVEDDNLEVDTLFSPNWVVLGKK